MKNKKETIVVSGIGHITTLGDTADALIAALEAGRDGTRRLTAHDCSTMPAAFGGSVDDSLIDAYGLDRIRFKLFSRYIKLGVIATGNALEDAGLGDGEVFDRFFQQDRRGVYVSTGVNGENAEGLFEAFSVSSSPDDEARLDPTRYAGEGIDLVHPRWILTSISNNLIFFLTSGFGLRGDNNNVTYMATGGAYMLDAAFNALKEGACDIAVVTGSDSLVNWQAMDDLAKSGVLCDGARVDRMLPYTDEADGGLPGEGAACLVLERMESAIERGIEPYAILLDSFQHSDCYDVVRPDPAGSAVTGALSRLLSHNREPVVVTLNGMSSPDWDKSELAGLARAREDGRELLFTAAKPYFCNTFSASFVVETAASLLAFKRGFVFPLPGDPGLDGFAGRTLRRALPYGIVLTQGLAGNTGGILFGRL